MDKQENNIDLLFRNGLESYAPARPSGTVWKGIRSWLDQQHGSRRKWLALFILALALCAWGVDDSRNMNADADCRSGLLIAPSAHLQNAGTLHQTVISKANDQKQLQTEEEKLSTNDDLKVAQAASQQASASVSGNATIANTNDNVNRPRQDDRSTVSGNNTLQTTADGQLPESATEDNISTRQLSNIELRASGIDSVFCLPFPASGGDRVAEARAIYISQYSDITSRITQPAAKNDPARLPFSLEAYCGPALSWNRLSGGSSMAQGYTDIRNAQEKEVWTYTAGIEAQYSFRGFFIGTGLNLINYGEQGNYNWSIISGIDTNSSYGQMTVISYPDPNNPNNTIIEFDSVWIHVEDTLRNDFIQNQKNRYSYLSVPLLLGYQIKFPKFGLRFAVGGSLDIACGAKGAIPTNALDGFTSISSSASPLKKTSFSTLFRLGLTYRLSNSTSLILEPEFRFSPWSMQSGTSDLSVKYYDLNLRIGLNYHF